jgi:prepilin-type N-terminal cleavage/methylation domain-containing protein
MSRPTKGFTLVEIAIVLVIVGLLLGGLLMPLATQVEVQRRIETEKTMEQIREAIIGFAMVNGRLPCPADPATATTTAGAGVARPFGAITCAGGVIGVVPWTTLGVSEVDAWGRRFTYRVTDVFVDQFASNTWACAPILPPTNSSFALCSPGDMAITVGAAPSANLAAAVPAVIVSHGKNGHGAFLSNGFQMPCPAVPPPFPFPPPPTTEEIQNGDCPTKNPLVFISHTATSANSPVGEFDDIVSWIVLPSLMKSMVDAGRLP